MREGPVESGAEIPSPDLVAAWLELDTLPTERVPLWAAHWIAGGCDGESLAELAGLSGDDPHDVRDLLPQALVECGVTTPDTAAAAAARQRAAATVAFNAVARLHLDGLATARWVVQQVLEIVEPEFSDVVTILPLGELVSLDDEWGAGWGRSDEELIMVVRRACLAQLGLPGA